jgi:drug/metabolite transporter (DMT)-like permease
MPWVTSRQTGTRLAAIVLLVLAWGSTFAAVKVGLDSAPPLLFAGLRSMLGGALMVVLAFVRSGTPRLRECWPAYALLTLLNVVLFFSLQTLAILELPSGLAAVLIYLQPVLTGVLAAPLLGESLTWLKVGGLLVGFAGIVVVSAGAIEGHVSGLGVGYAVAGALAWALGTIAFKRYADQVDVWWAVALPFLVGGVVMTLGGAAVEGTAVAWSGEFVVAFVYSAGVGTALSWSLWFGLVGSGEAGRVASYIFFVPLVSLVIGAVYLHETLGPSLLAGAALVIVGVFLVNRPPADRYHRGTAPRP